MDEYMGVIKLFAGSFAPKGWLLCNGQLLSINQYQALYSILNVAYGGDGITTFALPNLQARVPIGVSSGPSQMRVNLGQAGGAPTTTLTPQNLPPFSAPVTGALSITGGISAKVKVNSSDGDQPSPSGNYVAQNNSGDYDFHGSATAGSFLKDDAVVVSHNLAVSAGALAAVYNGQQVPLNTVSPYLGLNYIICVDGIYPSRP